MIFQGVQSSIAKKPYSFVIFQAGGGVGGGGGAGTSSPPPPSGSGRYMDVFGWHPIMMIITRQRETLAHSLLPIYIDGMEINCKTCLKRLLSKIRKSVFNTSYRFLQVKSIAECSKGSIMQYFGPSFSYLLSSRPLFLSF